MAKRKTIGQSPLDAVVPQIAKPEATPPAPEAEPAKVGGRKAAPATPAPRETTSQARPKAATPTAAKKRMTVHLPVELTERLKNAVYWTPGLTLAGLSERALEEAMERLEAEHGGPFQPREEDLRGGRPIT